MNLLGAFALTLILALSSNCCRAQTVNPQVTFEVRLSKETVMVGEPISAEVCVNNQSKEDFSLNVESASELGKIKITDLEGRSVHSLRSVNLANSSQKLPYRITSGVKFIFHVSTGKIVSLPFLANRDWVIRQPGKYRIQLLIRLPDSSLTVAPNTPTIVLEAVITVVPFSRERLQKVVENLSFELNKALRSDRMVGGQALAQQEVAIQALFSISESVAGESWNNLIETTSAYTHPEIWNQLSRLGTPTAYRLMQTITQRKEQARLEHQAQLEREQQENWRQMMENASQQP